MFLDLRVAITVEWIDSRDVARVSLCGRWKMPRDVSGLNRLDRL